MKKTLSIKQKLELKERKRVKEIREQISSQLSIIGFHRICDYIDDFDGSIKAAEIKEAKEKIAILEKQL